MSDTPTETAEITIKFSEQQMELVERLARETGKPAAESVAAALVQFISKEGFRYTR